MTLPADHPPVKPARLGVLLINLGTPDGTDYFSMRRYLSEFLSDPRVIELPRWLWQPILQLIILSRRPFASGHAYHSIWNTEKNESPLLTITRAQAEGVQARLQDDGLRVRFAMRYGNPSIAQELQALLHDGAQRVLLFPLYPQYCAATTASVQDAAFAALRKIRWQPALRTVPAYHDDPAYIQALADSVRDHLATLDWEPEVLVTSFHGIPKRYFLAGDPYHCFCAKTSRLLREALGWDAARWKNAFQSRFGREEWLKPYLDIWVKEQAAAGLKRLAVIAPGFAADCLETLEELNVRLREDFLAAGGTHFTYIPCLNATPEGVALLCGLITRELQGWT